MISFLTQRNSNTNIKNFLDRIKLSDLLDKMFEKEFSKFLMAPKGLARKFQNWGYEEILRHSSLREGNFFRTRFDINFSLAT